MSRPNIETKRLALCFSFGGPGFRSW